MKKIISIICIIIILLTLCSCKTKEKNLSDEYNINDIFTIVEVRHSLEWTTYIMYDNETKVMYYYIYSLYQAGLCPIYNSNGNVKIYK